MFAKQGKNREPGLQAFYVSKMTGRRKPSLRKRYKTWLLPSFFITEAHPLLGVREGLERRSDVFVCKARQKPRARPAGILRQ